VFVYCGAVSYDADEGRCCILYTSRALARAKRTTFSQIWFLLCIIFDIQHLSGPRDNSILCKVDAIWEWNFLLRAVAIQQEARDSVSLSRVLPRLSRDQLLGDIISSFTLHPGNFVHDLAIKHRRWEMWVLECDGDVLKGELESCLVPRIHRPHFWAPDDTLLI
jgi:hypothetical protein